MEKEKGKTMKQSELLKSLAIEFHDGQFRGDGVTPSITHMTAVAEMLISGEHCDEIVAAGWGHDLLEDNPMVTPQLLKDRGVDQRVIDTIVLLTHAPNMTDAQYAKYIFDISENEWATIVKIADMLCNMADTPTRKQRKKYTHSIWFLFTKNQSYWKQS